MQQSCRLKDEEYRISLIPLGQSWPRGKKNERKCFLLREALRPMLKNNMRVWFEKFIWRIYKRYFARPYLLCLYVAPISLMRKVPWSLFRFEYAL